MVGVILGGVFELWSELFKGGWACLTCELWQFIILFVFKCFNVFGYVVYLWTHDVNDRGLSRIRFYLTLN